MSKAGSFELTSAPVVLIDELGRALKRREQFDDRLRAVLAALNEAAPEAVVRVDGQVRRLLSFWREATPTPWFRPRVQSRGIGVNELAAIDGLEFLFLSHPDGRLRQAALEKLGSGLPNPYVFALVALRLNDWVAPVRSAAMACVQRTYPKTSAPVVARAALHVVANSQSWRRWTVEGAALDAALVACDAPARVIESLRDATSGPLVRLLRSALRNDVYDAGLSELAANARVPHVRAVALKTLIERRAVWRVGHEKRWVDKSLGVWRRVPTFVSRVVVVSTPRETLVEAAARDRSPAVRKIAADALVVYRGTLGNAEAMLELLLTDPSGPVRERADFVRRRRLAEDAAAPGG